MLIPVELERDRPLQLQLYEQLRDLVTTGRLKSGSRMPSTRMMAEQFAIARITVLLTYERLVAEGFLETRPARGTFVRHRVQHDVGAAVAPATVAPLSVILGDLAGSCRAGFGEPDPSLFPAGRWHALMRIALDRLGAQVRSEHPGGHSGLRAAIAGWLSTSRGLLVSPDQVILLNSRQQALHLVAHLVQRPEGRVIVEDPCDEAMEAALSSEGMHLLRVQVDAEGICTDQLPGGPAVLVSVTPEHQRPLGVMLSRSRREALLAWAERSGALVLEEDCAGELRYGDLNQPALMGLDRSGRVILLGGFATSLGPWINLAFLVVPSGLIGRARAARQVLDDRRSSLEESALAELIESGGYARHLHRLSRTYAVRRDTLLASLRLQFGETVPPWGAQAGLHLTWFPPDEAGPATYLAAQARRCGLDATAAPLPAGMCLPARQALQIGFGCVPTEQIERRVASFAEMAMRGPRSISLSAD